MDIKAISVQLTKEERAALYEVATRECRRPEQQVRYLLRQALGISNDYTVILSQPNSDASLIFPDPAGITR